MGVKSRLKSLEKRVGQLEAELARRAESAPPAKRTPVKRTPAKRAAAKKATATKAPAKRTPAKRA